MDKVLEQLNTQEKNKSSNKNVLKKIYAIYKFLAKVFLYAVLGILILIAILFVIYFIDMTRNVKNGVNKQPLFGAYVIISPSMTPTIKVNDAVVIERKDKDKLKVGDIITFLSEDPRYAGLTITHRIVRLEKSDNGDIFYRTKGDNNNSEDVSLVRYENIYGKVILKIPKIGYVQYFLKTSYGWIILVVVPCIGIVIYDFIKILKAIKERMNGKKNKKEVENNTVDILVVDESPKEESDNVYIVDSDNNNSIDKKDVTAESVSNNLNKNNSNNEEDEEEIEIL